MFRRSVYCAASIVVFGTSVLSAAGPLGRFADWTESKGKWKHKDNVFAQFDISENCYAFGKFDKWTDYTYEVQGRKISGEEGFLIVFRAIDTNRFYYWNLGGSGNKCSAIRQQGPNSRVSSKIPGSIQTGKWYDIKIQVRGPSIRCYLNKRLIHSIADRGIKSGGIGLGSWKTQVQYRNVKVTSSTGKLLYLTKRTYKNPTMASFSEKELTPAEKAEKARLAAVARAAAIAAAKLTSRLIEPFEDLTALKTTGEIKAIGEGPGVTQGKSAVEMAPEAVVEIPLRGADVTVLPWLRFDTHHSADQAQALRIEAGSRKRIGYVQSGCDTLAYPLSKMIGRTNNLPDTRLFTLKITNAGDAAIALDNLRLEPLVRPPLGAVMWDCGPSDSSVWPGFTRYYNEDPGLKKLKGPSLRHHKTSWPDALTRDFIGTEKNQFGQNRVQTVTITAPQAKSMTAWVWLTHYGYRGVQPSEYVFRPALGRQVAGKLRPAELLGTKCLLHGSKGAWTGKWYANEYCEDLVTLTSFNMVKGRTVVELGNCQIAALAMAPSGGRTALASAVKKIDGQLRQYRRQFTMGRFEPNACQLEPTGAEKEAGVMLFRVPSDETFTGKWKPRAEHRAVSIYEICRPGGTLRIPLAFVPLKKKSSTVSFTIRALRPDKGSALSFDRKSAKVEFVHAVPEVRKNTAFSRPWLFDKNAPSVEVGRIGYAWLSVSIPSKTRGDLYSGAWRINCGLARAEIPVTVEVVDSAPAPAKKLTVASWCMPHAHELYSTVYSSLAKPKRRILQDEVFKDITAAGVNAFVFDSVRARKPDEQGKRTLSFDNIRKTLARYPLKGFTGTVFFRFSTSLHDAKWGKGSSERTHLQNAISATNELRDEHGFARAYFYFGGSGHKNKHESDPGLVTRLAAAARLANEKCRVSVATNSTVLAEFQADEFARQFRPVSALILKPDSPAAAAQIASFKKLPGCREVFLLLPVADRFATGFFLEALGADGYFLPAKSIFMSEGGSRGGYSINGYGLVAPRDGGGTAKSVSAFRLSQGRDDFELVRHARALADRAASSKVSATEILDVLKEIESRIAALDVEKGLKYDPALFSTSDVSHAEMDSWRASLLNAVAIVNGRLKAPKRL